MFDILQKRYDIEMLPVDRVLTKEHLYEKSHAENVHQKWNPDPFLILLKNPKQSLHAKNSFVNQTFWKIIFKKL